MDLQIPFGNILRRRSPPPCARRPRPPNTDRLHSHRPHLRLVQRHGRRGIPRAQPRPSSLSHRILFHISTTTGRLLDLVPVRHYNNIETLFRATSNAIGAGVVAATHKARRRFWSTWTDWLQINFPSIAPDLSALDKPMQQQILAAYAHYVRSGGVPGTKPKVRAQTVQMALGAITATLLLDGKQSPLGDQKTGYPKAVSQLLEGYKRADPPPEPRLAVPLAVPRYLNTIGTTSTCHRTRARGDMAIIAFFFLLRVGEYTYHRESDSRLTRQFAINDVKLWRHTTLLCPTLPREILLTTCTAATMSLKNQKNGRKNCSIHVEATNADTCPIRAIVRRLDHINQHTSDQTTIISTYFTHPHAQPRMLTANEMTRAVRIAVADLGLERNGLSPAQVGSHSLRAGGAMAMYLNNVPHDTVRKIGRWQSDTFLMYIHEQIAAFAHRVSKKMSTPITFHNILFKPKR